ncbi:MAG TPA: acyl carrier protein [Acidimicrobiales bacterium]|nr:acyl carrier protein [Acidimicrobiales bacterium]HMS87239.1 acyl carrier protein [Acidimicrobiales bacterium]HRA33833.1 acyl carrier protein [Acidimicrobiales bacterium]
MADAPQGGVVTADAVLAELERILTEVVGDELLLDGPITLDTSFDADLQLESIEFVALSEQLLTTYGERVDFVTWLAGMELDDIIALTVGDVVGFVVASLQA